MIVYRNISISSQHHLQCNEEIQVALNKLINLELYSSYIYHELALQFDRDNVALPVFEQFFHELSNEERKHAEKLITFQTKRGGPIVEREETVENLPKEWNSCLEAMQAALDVEKIINQELVHLNSLATKHEDAQLVKFLQLQYHTIQAQVIQRLETEYDQFPHAPIRKKLDMLFDSHSHRKYQRRDSGSSSSSSSSSPTSSGEDTFANCSGFWIKNLF